jgi:hypothetical protein
MIADGTKLCRVMWSVEMLLWNGTGSAGVIFREVRCAFLVEVVTADDGKDEEKGRGI